MARHSTADRRRLLGISKAGCGETGEAATSEMRGAMVQRLDSRVATRASVATHPSRLRLTALYRLLGVVQETMRYRCRLKRPLISLLKPRLITNRQVNMHPSSF